MSRLAHVIGFFFLSLRGLYPPEWMWSPCFAQKPILGGTVERWLQLQEQRSERKEGQPL
jgi:hypothetical protein